jgi:hypothetical protein
MAEDEPQITDVRAYTEAHATAYADVAGAEPITLGRRAFTPGRVTVKYHWRTQLGDEGWTIGNIEIRGRWLGEFFGSGVGILNMNNAPEWARSFAEANMPKSTLVGAEKW